MSHYFISDCHLTPDSPETVDQFYQFIDQHQSKMQSLTILGDFFEVWIGDDNLDDWSNKILTTLKNLAIKKTFIAGNRDFLLTAPFLKQFGIELLPDHSKIQLNHQNIVLAHGDQLCTDDIKYQEFRRLVRSKKWQSDFLSKSLSERKSIVSGLRDQSKQAMKAKLETIMDVNEIAVKKLFDDKTSHIIIHGHTHREGLHTYDNQRKRLVLASWHHGISYLKMDELANHQLVFKLYPSNYSSKTE